MIQHKISTLPVVEDGQLVGIITETDIFKQLVTFLGGEANATRLTVELPDVPGQLAQVLNAIASVGGNLRSVVLCPTRPGYASATLWIESADSQAVITAIQARPEVHVIEVWDRDELAASG